MADLNHHANVVQSCSVLNQPKALLPEEVIPFPPTKRRSALLRFFCSKTAGGSDSDDGDDGDGRTSTVDRATATRSMVRRAPRTRQGPRKGWSHWSFSRVSEEHPSSLELELNQANGIESSVSAW